MPLNLPFIFPFPLQLNPRLHKGLRTFIWEAFESFFYWREALMNLFTHKNRRRQSQSCKKWDTTQHER